MAEGRTADFEEVFGRDGIWKELLKRAQGYLETEIARESKAERRYRVRDLWTWHRDFERFRESFSAEYERFERVSLADGLVEREQFVGAYYEKKRWDGDGDELVLS